MNSIWHKLPIDYPAWMRLLWTRVVWLFVYSQTAAVRFWFGAASIGFGSFVTFSLSDPTFAANSEYKNMESIAPWWIWSTGFFVHGLSLWYGVFTRTYNRLLVILEGLLGQVVWTASAIVIVLAQHTIGAQTVGACIAFWLLVRYPTHEEYRDAN
jgi:hypothetical protein